MTRGKCLVAILAGALSPLALAGCSSCKTFTLRTEMDEGLSRDGSHAIPVYVYFAPPEPSTGVAAIPVEEWFKNPLDFNDRIDPRLLISTKAVAGNVIQSRTQDLPEKPGKICIWSGNPPGAVAAGTRPERFHRKVDPKAIQGCAFDIIVKGDGLVVRTNNLEVREGAPLVLDSFAEMHWAEGMLLQPHHFQAWQRQILSTIRTSADDLKPYSYGLRKLEVAERAMENFIISIPRCEARLPDGTDLRVPDNANLPDLEVKQAMAEAGGKPLEIHLGVPKVRARTANQEGIGPPGLPRRYRLEMVEADDENSGDNVRTLEIRRLNARLYVAGDEALQHASAIPILRIVRAGEGEVLPARDPEFVPPTLELDGSPRLKEWAHEVLQRANARSNALSELIGAQQVDFSVESGGSPEMMLKLHVLNGFIPFYQQILRIPRLHPLEVYCELCRLAGQLAIFGESRRPPSLPVYDHGNPGPGFGKLFEIVDDLLKKLYIVKAPRKKFEPWGRFLVAALDPVWLEAGNSFYIAVDSELEAKDVAHILANQVSIGSKETIEQLAKNVIPGIRRRIEERTPLALPERPRRIYFRLDRKGGEQDLTVGTGELAIFNGSRKEMEFSLYVVSGEKGQFEL